MRLKVLEAEGPAIFVPFIHAFGGVERLILGLSRRLADAGRQHSIVCFEDTVGMKDHAVWRPACHALKPARNVLSEALALRRFLKERSERERFRPLLFDLKGAFYAGAAGISGHFLHFTDPPSLLRSDVSKFGFSFNRNSSLRSTGEAPSLLLRARGEAAHRLTRRGVRSASGVIVMTNRIAMEIQKLYDVIPAIHRPGVQGWSHTIKRNATRAEHLRLLSVCRLEEGKNLAWVVSGLRTALAECAVNGEAFSWSLEFVGAGPYERALREEVARAGLEDRTVFHGRVSDEKLAELYGQAGLALVPAAQGYGLPALEALSHGVPVVLNRASGVSEILGKSSWVEMTDDDEESFSIALRRMLERLRLGTLEGIASPPAATEDAWADEVCRTCGWLEATELPEAEQPKGGPLSQATRLAQWKATGPGE